MKKITGALVLAFTPFAAMAAGPTFTWTEEFIHRVSDLISLLLPIVMALALLFFLWGLAQFVIKSGDEKMKTEGKTKMIWGVITLFVMVSVWGIVQLIGIEFGVNAISNPPTIPTINGTASSGAGTSGVFGTSGDNSSGNNSTDDSSNCADSCGY